MSSTKEATKGKRFSKLLGLNRDGKPVSNERFDFPDANQTSAPSPWPHWVNQDNLLYQLGEKHQPTKRAHNYLVYYWMHFRDIHTQVKKVLEIGVQTERSLRMWEEFFPNAEIYGADIEPKCKELEGGRVKVLIGDQGSRDFCNQIVQETGGDFDIIIDDGSHKPEHQIASFNWLFPTLTQHGIYVMEDTGGVVGDTELRTINRLRDLIDNVMHWPEGYWPDDWNYLSKFDERASWADCNITGAAFYRWIAFIMRGNNPQDNPYLSTDQPPKRS